MSGNGLTGVVALLTLAGASVRVGAQEPPGGATSATVSFTRPPRAVSKGGEVAISFAVSRPIDVAVYIENAEGTVVRHLVAGVLGKSPPEPLAPGTLEQSLVWDRRDDLGKPVPAGRYRVRVAAGLKAGYAGTAFSEKEGPNNISGVIGLACGPGGRVYVLSNRWSRGHWSATAVHVFLRGGAYERTIKPFPPNLPPERVERIHALKTAEGRPLPVIHRVLAMAFYPYEDIAQQMAVTPNGNLHFVVVPAVYRKPPDKRLATINADGGVPHKDYAGGKLLPRAGAGHVCLAPASDGKAVYLIGVGNIRTTSAGPQNPPVVYSVALPERESAKPFFGDPAVTGAGDAHLNDPRGLATDGKGRLLIADRGNNRVVVVRERDGTFAGSFPVPSPSWVGVHRRTGAVYVRSEDHLVKFSGWDQPAERARLALPVGPERDRARVRWSFALDAEAVPAVVWIGRDRGGDALARCVDNGDRFSNAGPAQYYPGRIYWNVSVGRASGERRQVACKVGNYTLRILDEATGKARDLRLTGSHGQTYRLGPEGQVYGMDHWKWGVRRWDRDGTFMPFKASATDPEFKGRLYNRPSGTTSWERDFCVDRAGNVYTKHRGKHYHGRMRVDQYDPDGNFKRTVIWVVSDGALGPKVDAQGNIYVAECIKPLGKPYPDDFKDRLRGGRMVHQYVWMYGSIIKFSPKGGAVWFPVTRDYDEYGFDGQAKLAPGLPKEEVGSIHSGRMARKPAVLEGALWWRFGCSFLLDMHRSHNMRCHCTATDFDVDDFGRVFYPDQGRFRVSVLDTNGNDILHFGGYGNQDYGGPDSYVLDPKGRYLRPRRDDDPPGLVSPFAKPEIAFGWIVGLAATEEYAYVADALNRRVLRARLSYECEARVDVP